MFEVFWFEWLPLTFLAWIHVGLCYSNSILVPCTVIGGWFKKYWRGYMEGSLYNTTQIPFPLVFLFVCFHGDGFKFLSSLTKIYTELVGNGFFSDLLFHPPKVESPCELSMRADDRKRGLILLPSLSSRQIAKEIACCEPRCDSFPNQIRKCHAPESAWNRNRSIWVAEATWEYNMRWTRGWK